MTVPCWFFLPLLVIYVHCGPACHCTNGCDQHFKCLQGGQCTRGWLGPTCHIKNVAFNKTTKQKGVYQHGTSSLAVDGVTSLYFGSRTCSHTSPVRTDPWWSVDLGDTYLVNNIMIYLTQDLRMNSLSIEVDGHLCSTFKPVTPRSPENITCNTPLYGRNVNVSGENAPILAICEFEVLECENGTYGPSCTERCGICLDEEPCGKIDGKCKECEEGFALPLCQSHKCEAGTYGPNCTLRCGSCLAGERCGYTEGDCKNCEEGFALPLCKTCDDGFYGPNCDRCGRCRGHSTCNSKTGQCDEGCEAGWRGDKCLEECKRGSYGLNCSHTCGHCAVECGHEDGSCGEDGCMEGWIGQICKEHDFRKLTRNIATSGSVKVFDVIQSISPHNISGNASVTTDTSLTTCVSISGTQPTWRINFKEQHVIYGLVIYMPTLVHPYYVNVMVDGAACYLWSSLPQFPDQNVFSCYQPVSGRSVTIYVPRGDNSKKLTLCEVQIYADAINTTTTAPVPVAAVIGSCFGILVTVVTVLLVVFVVRRRKLGCFKPKGDEERDNTLLQL